MTDNNAKEKVPCCDCGKEVELEGGLLGWAKKNPDKFRCPDCQTKRYANGKAPAGKNSGASKTATASAKKEFTPKKEINATLFRQAFDELRAEFADVAEEVAPYMGGWVSTIVINRSK